MNSLEIMIIALAVEYIGIFMLHQLIRIYVDFFRDVSKLIKRHRQLKRMIKGGA